MQDGRKWYFFNTFCLILLKIKGLRILNIVQNVRINLYFDIPSKTQFRQKCHLRPSCIQPTKYFIQNSSKEPVILLLLYFVLFNTFVLLRVVEWVALIRFLFGMCHY